MIGFGFEFQTNFKFSHHFFFHLKMCNWQMTISFTILTSMTAQQNTHTHTHDTTFDYGHLNVFIVFVFCCCVHYSNWMTMRWWWESCDRLFVVMMMMIWPIIMIIDYITHIIRQPFLFSTKFRFLIFIHTINQSIDWLFVWLTRWLRMHIKVILSYPSFTNFLCVCLYSFIHSFFFFIYRWKLDWNVIVSFCQILEYLNPS